MQIIPVLDIQNGIVVRAVAGDRERYHPLRSPIADSTAPAIIIRAFQKTFSLREFYIADLDAIQGRPLNRCMIAELARGCDALIVDRGVRTCEDIEELLELHVDQVVVALETLPDLPTARSFRNNFGPEQLIVSLDLRNGRPLTVNPAWQKVAAADIAAELFEVGYQDVIVLDLAGVGVGAGLTTLSLCLQLRKFLPSRRIITGGGVRNLSDLRMLQDAGIDAVLVASALHDGTVTAQDLETL